MLCAPVTILDAMMSMDKTEPDGFEEDTLGNRNRCNEPASKGAASLALYVKEARNCFVDPGWWFSRTAARVFLEFWCGSVEQPVTGLSSTR